ncbi:MAG: uridine diphosphate-N-acetylglucosamine-binding protein YvcK [Holophagaceae bacterium]|jgi:uncharacterized cofD-like protein
MLNPENPLRIAALGGGTGLSGTLKALRVEAIRQASPWNISGIVTTSDDGGSSGRIREEFGSIPPGDLRNCLSALVKDDSPLSDLLDYRFAGTGPTSGHSLGNLMLSALADISGSWVRAIRQLSNILVTVGHLYPASVESITLQAEDANGNRLSGESKINMGKAPFRSFWIEPRDVEALPDSVLAIQRADIIILSSGSLYTSTLANLLIEEIREAIEKSKAPIVYIANIMTEPNETLGMSLENHLDAIEQWGKIRPNWVIVNDTKLPESMAKRYELEGGSPITYTGNCCGKTQVFTGDLLDLTGCMARHSSTKLNHAIKEVIVKLESRSSKI